MKNLFLASFILAFSLLMFPACGCKDTDNDDGDDGPECSLEDYYN